MKSKERNDKKTYYFIEIPRIAKLLFPVFLKIHNLRRDKIGVIYHLLYKKINLSGGNIGSVPYRKLGEYMDFSLEKLRQVFNNRKLTSLQFTKPVKNEHEGVILVNDDLYISIHGLPEGLNQEFAILIAVAARELDSRMYTAIQLLSQKKEKT